MKHIEVLAYDAPSCGGLVEETAAVAPPPREGHRSLPILGLGAGPAAAEPARRWRCQRCGRAWDREPLPDEAL